MNEQETKSKGGFGKAETPVPTPEAPEKAPPKWTYVSVVKVNKKSRMRFYTDERKALAYQRQVRITGFQSKFTKVPYGSETNLLAFAMRLKDDGLASEVLIDME